MTFGPLWTTNLEISLKFGTLILDHKTSPCAFDRHRTSRSCHRRLVRWGGSVRADAGRHGDLRAQLGPAHADGSFHRRVARVTKRPGGARPDRCCRCCRCRILNIDPIVFFKIFIQTLDHHPSNVCKRKISRPQELYNLTSIYSNLET